MSDIIKLSTIENKIIEIRNQQVIIDFDVAELYGVQTKEINQAVRNNPEKFPNGYVLELNSDEKNEVVKIFDHLQKLKYSAVLPKTFTEKGLYMLATILRSEKATETTIGIIETFTKLRAFSRTVSELVETKEEKVQKSLMKQSAEIMTELLGNDKDVAETETSIELNFAVLKIKHTIKRKNSDNEVHDEEPIYIKIKK
ncbi:MAG: ORF6N domain-containing protein [Bacteroidales bacterium]|nr:ORF6N domain-containing protein [Bacteroidales bacterium]